MLQTISPGPTVSLGLLGDLYTFDLAAMNWTRLLSDDAAKQPPARSLHGFTSDGGRLYVHGGNQMPDLTSVQHTWTSLAGGLKRINYGNNENMAAIIAPTGAKSIELQFCLFDTEFSYDFVIISRCNSISCSKSFVIGQYSGWTIPESVMINSSFLLIEWTSDPTTTAAGWSLTWNATTSAGIVLMGCVLSIC